MDATNPQSNPKDNYETFERLHVHARDKHLPINNVKYLKHKLNKWMTNGILKSINRKDIIVLKNFFKQVLRIMYMTLLKTNFNTYEISCDKI